MNTADSQALLERNRLQRALIDERCRQLESEIRELQRLAAVKRVELRQLLLTQSTNQRTG